MCWQKCSMSARIDLMMINCQNTVHCLFRYFLMAILLFQADIFSHFSLVFLASHCVITILSNDSMGHDFSALSLIFGTGSGNIWKPGGQPTKWRSGSQSCLPTILHKLVRSQLHNLKLHNGPWDFPGGTQPLEVSSQSWNRYEHSLTQDRQ